MHSTNACTVATFLLLAACATSRPQTAYSPFHPEAFAVAAPTGAAAPATTASAAPDVSLGEPRTESLATESWGRDVVAASQAPRGRLPKWRDGAALLTGYFGASIYDVERDGRLGTVKADDVEVPAIGGGGQLKLAGDKIDLGLEGLIGFNWRASSTAVAVGGGGAAVAVSIDMFVLDLYGGPFASMFLGDSVRIYGGAGPLMQWANYDESNSNQDGDGFGLGYYVRTGLDFHVGRGSLLGVGVRWSDTEIDLGGDAGDLQAEGLLWMITYSYFY